MSTESIKALLKLKNGHTFVGCGVGQVSCRYGECVFTTSMTGYTQSLTDPSYAGQILCFASPLIGNIGVSYKWFESPAMFADGVIMANLSDFSFHADKNCSLEDFLITNQRGGIAGIDTRQLVQILRDEGNQFSVLVVDTESKINELQELSFEELRAKVDNPEDIGFLDWPSRVNQTPIDYSLYEVNSNSKKVGKKVVLLDCGVKANIVRELSKRVELIVLPANSTIEEILKHEPDGVLLSNGPGDPRDYDYIIDTVKNLLSTNLPIMGICLGHQLLSLAIGCEVYKMKFGNRGANQPVQDELTQKAYLTSQNHGYAVQASSLPNDYSVFFQNLNDDSVEGIIHKTKPIFSVQFHPEAAAGPQDTNWLFDKFVDSL